MTCQHDWRVVLPQPHAKREAADRTGPKTNGSQLQIEARTYTDDVRVASTASPEMTKDMPVPKAGWFDVPGGTLRMGCIYGL